MKRTIKTMMFFVAGAFILASCSEDPNPPVAGFSLSNETPVQWDMSVIATTATGATEESFAVTGGEFVMVDDATIQFLEAKTYTVTQTVTNADGTVESSQDVVVTEPDNTYTLDGTELTIGTTDFPNPYWYDASAMGGTVYIRMQGDEDGNDNPNLIKLYPVAGPNALEATYTYNDSGDIGTYDAGMSYNWDGGFGYDWTTSGETGNDLVISLVYAASNAEDNVYDITLSSYTLNYGNWDFASCFCFIGEGTKPLSVSYRGKIDPAS